MQNITGAAIGASLESASPLSSRTLPDRRSFLSGLSSLTFGALAAGLFNATPARAEHDLTPPAVQLNAEQRIQVLDQINQIVTEKADPHIRITQMEIITPLATSYRQSLLNAKDLTLHEINKASEIVRLKINMPHFSDHIPHNISAPFINHSAIHFYGDLLRELKTIRSRSFPDDPEIKATYQRIYTDLLWSKYYKSSDVSRQIGTVVAQELRVNQSTLRLDTVATFLSFDPDQKSYYQALFSAYQDIVPSLISTRIDEIEGLKCEDARASFQTILDLASSIRNTSKRLAQSEKKTEPNPKDPTSQELTVGDMMQAVDDKVCERILPDIIPLWCLGNKAFHSRGPLVNYGGIIELFGPPPPYVPNSVGCQQLASKVKRFCDEYSGPRSFLGEQIEKSLGRALAENLAQELNLHELSKVLALVPTSPQSKAPLVNQLRREILDTILYPIPERSSQAADDSKAKVASILRALLLSDHSFSSSLKSDLNGETPYDSSQALAMFKTALSRNDGVTIRQTGLSPTQTLLLELACVATHGAQSGTLVREGEPLNETQRVHIEELLILLTRNLYALGCHDLYSPDPHQQLMQASYQETNQSYVSVAPDTSRQEHFCQAIRHLVSHADALTLKLADFSIPEIDEDKIIDRLVVLTNLIEARGTHARFGGGQEARVEFEIKKHFPFISETASTGPFAQAHRTIRNILYQNKHQRLPPWDILPDTIEGTRLRDKKLDQMAVELTNSFEKTCIVDFFLKLTQPESSREDRPVDALTLLSHTRAVSETKNIIESFGLTENHSQLRALFALQPEQMTEKLRELKEFETQRQKEMFALLKPAEPK